jgi:pyruvate kinase
MRRTKIVCTIGPATRSVENVHALIDAGMNVARLNFSHGTQETHAAVIQAIRSHPQGESVAILQDLSGPKVRIGEIAEGTIELQQGAEILLTSDEVPGDIHAVSISIPEMTEVVPVGAQLLLDDGNIEFRVKARRPGALVCEVVTGGILSAHKGVNAPGVSLPIAAVTDKDLENLQFGIAQKVDWVAASFIRCAADIAVIRGICQASRAKIGLIAKIEKHEAVRNIDEIIEVVDGIMVARGDLGVEIPIHEVPITQKMIIKKCNAVGKPVITATQMLESMIQNPRPTRAEVSDVANAILDGTDAVMLSGETAAGAYPFAAVKMMDKIARFTEASRRDLGELRRQLPIGSSITLAVGQAACDMARDLDASVIVTATSSGSTAIAVSRFRPKAQILALTHKPEIQRRLALVWGVRTVHVGPIEDSDHMIEVCISEAQRCQCAPEGSVIVMTGGVPVGSAGNTNFIRAHRMGQALTSDNAPI